VGIEIPPGCEETDDVMRCLGTVRALVALLVLGAVAHADPLRVFDETPDAFQLPPPTELASKLDRDAVFERAAMFDHALAGSRGRARSNLILALGDLWTGYALYEDALFAETQDIDRHIAAEVALDRAKIHYRQLADDVSLSGWPNLEHALIHYAFVLRRKHEPATAPLERLVDEFPASRDVAHAHLALGDEAIWRNTKQIALLHYAKAAAIAFPERAQALYKQAWTELQLENAAAAFPLLERAITAPGHEAIDKELQRVFVATFVRLGEPANAYEAFTRAYPDQATEMLELAAIQWQRLGRTKEAMLARRELLRRAPMDPRACSWEDAVARLAFALDDHMEFLASVERLVRRFEQTHDEACEASAQDQTLSNARAFARTARRKVDDLIIAERLYDLFLRSFPQHEEFAAARLERIRLRARMPQIK
jgi:tetratricopeptide (TPR) repeat protein